MFRLNRIGTGFPQGCSRLPPWEGPVMIAEKPKISFSSARLAMRHVTSRVGISKATYAGTQVQRGMCKLVQESWIHTRL